MPRTCTVFLVILILGLAGVSAAATMDAGNSTATGNAAMTDKAMEAKDGAMSMSGDVFRAEALLNREVRFQGEQKAEIVNLLIDPVTGKIPFVVVSEGGFLGIGADRYLVPWEKMTLDLNVSGYTVASMKRDVLRPYDRERGGYYPYAKACADYEGYSMENYLQSERAACDVFRKQSGEPMDMPKPQANGAPARPDETMTAMSADTAKEPGLIEYDHLEDMNVVGPDGSNYGEIEEVYIDPQRGQVVLVAVEHGGFLKMNAEEALLPYSSLRLDRENRVLVSSIPKDKLEEMPLKENRNRYSDEEINRIYEQYGYRDWMRDSK